MEEKRKPFATIYLRKPRKSVLLSTFLILAIVAVAASMFMQERDEQAAKLNSLEDSLQIVQSSLQIAEDQLGDAEDRLADAESRIAEYQVQLGEPLGFYDFSEGRGKSLRFYSCSRNVNDALSSGDGDGATLITFDVLDRKATSDLLKGDNYDVVGNYDWQPEGYRSQTIIFYMRKDVLARDPFTLQDQEEWDEMHLDWSDHLEYDCHRQ